MEANKIRKARDSGSVKILIEVINPVEARVEVCHIGKLYPCLSFKTFYYKKKWVTSESGKTWVKNERIDYRKKIYTEKDGYIYFPTGLLPKTKNYCTFKGMETETIYTNSTQMVPTVEPKLSGITLRKDQIDLIQRATARKRGVIQSPTGSGKTILQMGLVSQYPTANILIITHTIGIVKQTMAELKKFGYNSQQVGSGEKPKSFTERIVVGTVQTFDKLPLELYENYFDVVMVDEAHHVSTFTGRYAKVLSGLLSPIRLGFTATLPTDTEAKIALESFIGPLIKELSIHAAVKLDILAKPRIKLLKVPNKKNIQLTKSQTYNTVYKKGIVENSERNDLIIDETIKYIKKGKSCLILVKNIEHGRLLTINGLSKNFKIPFVEGSTLSEDRENYKDKLISKEIPAIICTTVWREGINIPTLDVIMNAAGGKSEIMTLQGIGRGLRKTGDKKEVILVDFFDSTHHFLISHFGERITLYMDQGWL